MLIEAQRLWKLFAIEYGSSGVQCFDYPNVTFQVGHCQDVTYLGDALAQLSHQFIPFELTIDGWACFERSGVFYLKVHPTAKLGAIHRAVNGLLRQHGVEVFDHYRLEEWVPHVTVAMQDLTAENLTRAKQDMQGYHPRYRQLISNIHLVQRCHELGRIELVRSIRVSGRHKT